MRKIAVVTTFHDTGYDQYASRMIDTYLENWPNDIDLHAYAQDCVVKQSAPNLVTHDLLGSIPELAAFRDRWGSDPKARGQVAQGPVGRKGKTPGIGFRWDAIRFSHKVYAVCHAAKTQDLDIVFWMDADMVCHSPITREFIESMIPESTGVAFLGRRKKFTETGLYALNIAQAPTRELVDLMQHCYDDAEHDLFALAEWHDCWVFDRKREIIQKKYPDWKQLSWSETLDLGEGHPLINTAWGEYLDHLKGDRKKLGRSKNKDLVKTTQHRYWNP